MFNDFINRVRETADECGISLLPEDQYALSRLEYTCAEPGSHFVILWNHDGAFWYHHVDQRDPRHYERKFIIEIDENGDPYLYEEVWPCPSATMTLPQGKPLISPGKHTDSR